MSRTLAVFFARTLLGLMFFMTGVYRVFQLGVLEHARRFFVGPYADTFLPGWSLWLTGTAIPFAELVGGSLMLLGLRVREAAVVLATVLVVVTFGHLLIEPFFQFQTHIMPRFLLLLVVLLLPRDEDRLSVDYWMAKRRRAVAGR